jgi:hypothetical protein
MMNARNIQLTLLVVALVLTQADMLKAQGPAPPPAQNEVPIDGFSALLLAAGAGYGASKLRRKKM